ncbi:hypothetical protein HDV04_004559 [Boothiomyces sp. JEL0838]|nr:hypothetical protein HDV04_004559 [Boothiomyces sp. JEL0838]
MNGLHRIVLHRLTAAQDFVTFIGLFYGTIVEFCHHETCPVMSAGPSSEYFWVDSQKRNVKIPAVQYIDYVFSWVQTIITDENIFPTKAGIYY